ncbi:MAG: histidine triad nucleotide-binding protein [Proteobacteria bacterium]|nr:histidine triad nucleotide-binding protein [Desulfobulbaceae bacterium]MBU4151705.1 histidine triad nucleotide-binding protein [Pseudomonadota bacterium]MDP2106324.1 histidine triad nucleotide-binding protein [Desulfobulbaceae bacterium]
MSDNCLFCKIIKGQIPASKVYEDDDILAFHDISPQAPVHFLVIPKKHLSGPSAIGDADRALIGKVMQMGATLANELGEKDFRFVVNNGAEAGQTVFHFHLHVLGGRSLSWPPG